MRTTPPRSLWRLALTLLFVATATRAMAQMPAAPASSAERIRLGGYAAVTFRRAPDSSAVRIAESNVAAIISGSLSSRVSYLVELDGVSSSRQNYAGRQDDHALEVARLYADVSANDLLRLRVGRFLTPIGQWNEIHAEPLTWTAVRPLATYRSFAKYSTGATVAGQGVLAGRDAGYALWIAPSLGAGELDEAELEFRGAMGARLAVEPVRGLWLGVSGALLHERRPESSFDDDSLVLPPGADDDSLETGDEGGGRALLGADLTARVRGFELRAEATVLGADAQRSDERTAFVQLVAPLGGRLSAVGRAEYLSTASGGDARVWLIGLHWRGPRGLVLKMERQDAGRAPTAVASGWFLSVSSLF